MLPDKLRTRLAPTPSGYLHQGNGLSFLVTWLLARAAGGHILLRIDDLDAQRRRDAYLADIFETIDWLGIDYDEGPAGVEDFLRNWSQHTRLEEYNAALHQLRQQGDLYACTCTRRQIRRPPDGKYPLTCRDKNLPFDTADTAWRLGLRNGEQVTIREWRAGEIIYDPTGDPGDFVVRQKTGLPAYQIASLVDDTRWNINFIVRGQDLLPSTAAQLILADRLGHKTFQQTLFWHHSLILQPSGEKLSKSAGSAALSSWREAGRGPEELYRQAAAWISGEAVQVVYGLSLAALQRDLLERIRHLLRVDS